MDVFGKKFASVKEKTYSVCFFDDLLEFCSDNLFQQALPTVLAKFESL